MNIKICHSTIVFTHAVDNHTPPSLLLIVLRGFAHLVITCIDRIISATFRYG